MTVLSAQTVRRLKIIEPFNERTRRDGFTFGLSPAGYDIRIAEDVVVAPGFVDSFLLISGIPNEIPFKLASSIEKFNMPLNVIGEVKDKSTWVRCGLAVQNTTIEPGWRGYLTLELTNHSAKYIEIKRGCPIAQIVFYFLDEPTEQPYEGKYQDQDPGPQEARFDKEDN